jgi:hypothetical protein
MSSLDDHSSVFEKKLHWSFLQSQVLLDSLAAFSYIDHGGWDTVHRDPYSESLQNV